jgi:uncharacterized cysteine cluster protein YcgN (CxxCxxCC family)
MLGYVSGHLDTNLGNAKSACQLLGQKKDICKNWNPLGEFDMQCTNKFFSIQMVPSKCNYTWMKYRKKTFFWSMPWD